MKTSRWIPVALLLMLLTLSMTGNAASPGGAEIPPPSSPLKRPSEEPDGAAMISTAKSNPSLAGKRTPATGDKAVPKLRPTQVPEFDLPEVVITGENRLTIGAKRLERRTEDVTLGTRELRGLDRPVNDLPGLEKSLTALSMDAGRGSKDTTFILHAGGGRPSCWGGWALWGQEYGMFRYLLSADTSDGRGEIAGPGRMREKRRGYGVDLRFRASRDMDFHLSRIYSARTEDLPHLSSREERRGASFVANGEWRLTENVKARLNAESNDLPIDLGIGNGTLHMRIREPKASLLIITDVRHPLVEGIDLSGGFRHAMGNFLPGAVNGYRLGWADLTVRLKAGERVRALTAFRHTRTSTFDSPKRLDPRGEISLLAGESTRLSLSARRERIAYDLVEHFLREPYTFPADGFLPPLDIERQFGVEIVRKVGERILLTLSGSQGRWGDRMQWTDASSGMEPLFLRVPQVLKVVDFHQAASRLEFDLRDGWSIDWAQSWILAQDVAGDAWLTDLPRHAGALSLTRKTGKLEAVAGVTGNSTKNAFGNRPGTYGSNLTGNLSVRYAQSRSLTLWMAGRNLNGARFETAPGYAAPRFHITAGIEVVF